MNYSKIMCPTNQTMRIKKTVKYMILSPKKKKEKKKTDSQGRPTRNCIIPRNKNWLDKWKGWLKIDFQDSGEKKYPEKLIYLNSYKSKQKKAY